jgi:glycosyltransferase involved in cell wall biosynthesis
MSTPLAPETVPLNAAPLNAAPLVSIVIPCFNVERFVAEAVNSAMAQTHPAIEVIVVDDASADGTASVLRGFGDRIRLETNRANAGPGATRNRGLALARGEFVQFLDADDVLAPEKVQRCLAAFAADVDMVFCRNEYFRDDHPGGWPALAQRLTTRLIGHMRWEPSQAAEYVLREEVQTAMPLYRAESLRRVGGFREDLWSLEDTELHFRVALSGAGIRRLDHVLVHCRHHGSPFRLRTRQGRFLESLRALDIMRGALDGNGAAGERVHTALADRYANVARKLLGEGHRAEAEAAYRSALGLSKRPAPTNVHLYNALSRVVGFWRLERARIRIMSKTPVPK